MAGSLRRRKAAGVIYLALACLLAAVPLLMRLRRPAEIRIMGQIEAPEAAGSLTSRELGDDAPKKEEVETTSINENTLEIPVDTAEKTETVQVDPMVYVHVAGQVVKPGLYGLPVGSRVHHAVEAAGGFNSNADRDSVNIALPVSDGQQVYIPKKAVTAQTTPAQKPAVAQSKNAQASASKATKTDEPEGRLDVTVTMPVQLEEDVAATPSLIDINSASATELETLPGIGPSTAAKIIEHRRDKGPFTSIEGLMDVNGIGPAKFAALKDLVMVK